MYGRKVINSTIWFFTGNLSIKRSKFSVRQIYISGEFLQKNRFSYQNVKKN